MKIKNYILKKENIKNKKKNFNETYGRLYKYNIIETIHKYQLQKIIIYNYYLISKIEKFQNSLTEVHRFLLEKYFAKFCQINQEDTEILFFKNIIIISLFDISKIRNYDFINKVNDIIDKHTKFSYFENITNYQKIKKYLFSWNGPYSDLDTFYNNSNNIKFKIYYFLSQEMICPLIKPIINIKTYNINENKFSPEQIFSDKKNYYSINLNIL